MTDPNALPASASAVPKFAAVLKRVWPHADSYEPGLVEGLIAAAPVVFPKYGAESDLAICHAMAQFSEECGYSMRKNWLSLWKHAMGVL